MLYTTFLTAAARRTLLTSFALLVGQSSSTSAETIQQTSPDAEVITACRRFNELERKKLDILDGGGQIEDDAIREATLDSLLDPQIVLLESICKSRATTLAGHRARAICFALWDGGETAYRAYDGGGFDDRLITALVRDLAGVTGW